MSAPQDKPSRTRPAIRARAPLSTGVVTFLFTDIEGSTRLWETQGAAMRVALARHDALMKEAIASSNGSIFKKGGDSFYAVFREPADALTAAFDAQRALNAQAWPDGVSIKVRMALHSGVAELRDGDYFGPPLNRAARLMGAAHGGQTVLSDTVYEHCKHALPRGVRLKRLGVHTLRDVAEPTTVFQLCHRSLPEFFPPLSGSAVDTTPSIAVLPFVNMSHDEANEYFADGLAEELLNVLAKVRGLRVAARSSAFTFKGKGATVGEIGRALNVATVLEGSVRNAGNRMRISVQLVKVADGFHLWSQSYDRTLEDILAVQDDIAQSVVQELRSTLLGGGMQAKDVTHVAAQITAAVKGRASDAEAHRLYLQGRHLIGRHTRDDTAKGIAYLKQALERDTKFALGWAELAGAYTNEAAQGWEPVAAGLERARHALARALELEPELAEAHAQSGWIRMTFDWDWRGAEAAYGRALELAPGNAFVLRRVGWLAANFNRLDEAITLYRQAIEQDALSASTYHSLGMALEAADRLTEAEQAYRKVLELSPHRTAAHAVLALNLLSHGRVDEAIEEGLREAERWARLWSLAIVYHRAGRLADADAALSELIANDADGAAYNIAQVYGARGDADLAFQWLDQAYAQRDAGLSEMKPQPLLRLLHADPRWSAFLRKMDLDD